jgi:hypothetical protein
LELAAGEENSISDIRRYFEDNAKPLEQREFIVFWQACSEEDRQEFKRADLSKMK